MSKWMVWLMAVALLCSVPHACAQAKGEAAAEKAATAAEKTTSITEKTKSMEKMPGYFNIYWDAKAGKLWLEIDKWGTGDGVSVSELAAGGNWFE